MLDILIITLHHCCVAKEDSGYELTGFISASFWNLTSSTTVINTNTLELPMVIGTLLRFLTYLQYRIHQLF